MFKKGNTIWRTEANEHSGTIECYRVVSVKEYYSKAYMRQLTRARLRLLYKADASGVVTGKKKDRVDIYLNKQLTPNEHTYNYFDTFEEIKNIVLNSYRRVIQIYLDRYAHLEDILEDELKIRKMC